MKKTNLLIALIGTTALLNLTACTYIKNLFPDKEKDYQFTTEIPELVLPANLGKDTPLKMPVKTVSPSTTVDKAAATSAETTAGSLSVDNPATDPTSVTDSQPVESGIAITAFPDEPSIVETPIDNTDNAPEADAKTPITKPEPITIERLKAADGNAQLRLGEPLDQAWRTVDKALSRKAIEITNRDKQANAFTVQYDPNEKQLEDGSLWDEALFIFGGFQDNEKEFFVKLIDSSTDTKQQTDIVILDKTQQPSTDTRALSLLDLLQKTIETDFAK
ncbi:MAG: outer membrane protein assembly factor BamC [Methylovulum sp.]|nr:outer membrane protein assembly factor BamC [Methylovulum sp.]